MSPQQFCFADAILTKRLVDASMSFSPSNNQNTYDKSNLGKKNKKMRRHHKRQISKPPTLYPPVSISANNHNRQSQWIMLGLVRLGKVKLG